MNLTAEIATKKNYKRNLNKRKKNCQIRSQSKWAVVLAGKVLKIDKQPKSTMTSKMVCILTGISFSEALIFDQITNNITTD